MISVSTNISVVIKAKLAQLEELRKNPDPVLRTVALAVLPELKHRVHVEGKDSKGGQIGTYSPGYMAVRTGNFQDAAKITRGVNAGKFKDKKSAAKGDAGKFSKGTNTGGNRQVYNRDNSTKVILSLTRQMENDLSVIPSGNGYGIGYNNPDNYKKALWADETYKKKILTKLTKEEVELAKKTAENFLPEYLKNIL